MKIHAVNEADAPFIRTVMERLLRAYDGRRLRWALKDSETLWLIHPGWRASVVGVQVEGRKCCAKFFFDQRRRAKLRNRLGFPKAGRAFRKGRELARRGVPTPAPWGFAVDWASGFAVLVCELIEHADSVDHELERAGAEAALAEQLGRFVRRMHEAGVAHRDLSLSNFLRRADGTLLLVDYEDCRFFDVLPERVRWQNLRHLNARARALAPPSLRKAFLRAYWHDKPAKRPPATLILPAADARAARACARPRRPVTSPLLRQRAREAGCPENVPEKRQLRKAGLPPVSENAPPR